MNNPCCPGEFRSVEANPTIIQFSPYRL